MVGKASWQYCHRYCILSRVVVIHRVIPTRVTPISDTASITSECDYSVPLIRVWLRRPLHLLRHALLSGNLTWILEAYVMLHLRRWTVYHRRRGALHRRLLGRVPTLISLVKAWLAQRLGPGLCEKDRVIVIGTRIGEILAVDAQGRMLLMVLG